MKNIEIRELDSKRFNALAGHSRSPSADFISKELSWYSNQDESLLGVLLLDLVDNDYAGIILVRDEVGQFRAFDTQVSMATREDAVAWLIKSMQVHTEQGLKHYPQGDRHRVLDLFASTTSPELQHPYFKLLAGESAFIPARAIINEMMPHFTDIDGNFVEQFQTTGFDARLWELYVFEYLVEERLFIERSKRAPDFIVSKYGKTVAIEAVIVGRKEGNQPKPLHSRPKLRTREEILESHKDEMPIRFGSPLYRKLQGRYWELPHVAGRPLVFAIADFHDDQSMLWSGSALVSVRK